MKQGEIWFVKFLNSVGYEYKKDRPALVIESNSQIKKSNVFTVMPLTSNLGNRIEDDILIKKDENNRLYRDSVLKVYQIQSFDKSRFLKKIGKVNGDTLLKVKKYLKNHFDL